MQTDPTRVELLLVDDDDEFRETVASRFRTRGFPVTGHAVGRRRSRRPVVASLMWRSWT